jgi:yeast amino acid transporter
MLLQTMWALGELAVLYPVNGAYFNYAMRFIDPSWLVGARLRRLW